MIKNFIIGAIILAAIATGIAFVATYWYVVVGIGALAFGGYYVYSQQKDKANKV